MSKKLNELVYVCVCVFIRLLLKRTHSMNLKHAAVILDLSYIYSQGDLKSNPVKNGNDLLMLRVSLHAPL